MKMFKERGITDRKNGSGGMKKTFGRLMVNKRWRERDRERERGRERPGQVAEQAIDAVNTKMFLAFIDADSR